MRTHTRPFGTVGTLLAALVLSTSAASAGQFDGVTVRLATFGGKWRDIVAENVVKAFEAEGGKVEFVLGQPANNVAKLIAARGQEPPFDVLEVMDNFLPSLTAGKLIEPFDLARIPNVAKLDPSMYDPLKVMVWITQEGIVYNKAKFAEAGLPPPASYGDLAHPKLAGKVSVPDISAGGAMPAIVGMAYEAGGSEADIGPGLALIKKIAPASFWSSSSNLQTQLVGGDVWAAAAQAGNVQRLRDRVDLGIAFPAVNGKNGVLKQGYLVRVAGGKNAEAVHWIVNAFLAEKHQLATLRDGGQVPVNRDALAALAKEPEFSFLRLAPDQLAGMYSIDFGKVDEAAYVRTWNRTVTR